VAILLSEKLDFRLKSVQRDNECHFILIKGAIHQEGIIHLNIYVLSNHAFKYIKNQMTLKDRQTPQHSDSGRIQ
jgi:hypothetical protein